MLDNRLLSSMSTALAGGLRRLHEVLQNNPACLGMFLWGSLGTETADEWSDLDVAVVIRDDGYKNIKQDLKTLCERCFGSIVAWLPEGEREGLVNYAGLFEAAEELVLFDLLIMSETVYNSNPMADPERILFDREGLLERQASAGESQQPQLSPDRLGEALHDYWIYMYLNGKYARRGDLYRLASTQYSLFERHVNVLRFLEPDRRWTGWASKDVCHFPAQCREALLIYLGGITMNSLGEILQTEMDALSRDAHLVCCKCGMAYIGELEMAVRRHLQQVPVLNRRPSTSDSDPSVPSQLESE